MIEQRRYRAYLNQLVKLREVDPFRFLPLSGTVFQTALRQQRSPRQPHCRSLDRLHLAAMKEFGLRRLMTNDAAQAAGARALGFEVVSPGHR